MKAELLRVFGDDTFVCDAARVSFAKDASAYTSEQNARLIKYLADHNHWSPFSHPKLSFRLTMPIYVERQLIKTQAGVEYNSISGRYVDFSDTYYEIEQFRKQSKDSKQGSAENIAAEENDYLVTIQRQAIDYCSQVYAEMIARGVSKEQARSVLPLSLQTSMVWTGSLYAFIRLCKQRLKPDAQQETRELVQLMLDQVRENGSFTESLRAYGIYL